MKPLLHNCKLGWLYTGYVSLLQQSYEARLSLVGFIVDQPIADLFARQTSKNVWILHLLTCTMLLMMSFRVTKLPFSWKRIDVDAIGRKGRSLA